MQTPEMALWGISIYFLFILLKLASWVYALKAVATYVTKRIFDWREKKSSDNIEIENIKKDVVFGENILKRVNRQVISGNEDLIVDLIRETRNLKTTIDSNYTHTGDLEKAISILKEYKLYNNKKD
jgi:hypothetical protein